MLNRPRISLMAEGLNSSSNATKIGSPGDISFLIQVAFRRRILIGAFALGGFLIGLIAFAVLPRQYMASTQLIIDFRRLAIIAPNEATFNYRMSDAAVQTQVAIVTSDSVLRRTVDKLELTKDPDFVGEPGIISKVLAFLHIIDDPAARSPETLRDEAVIALRKAVTSEREAISYMITVKATSRSAEKSARIADAVADSYAGDQFAARTEIAERAHEWFKARLQELQDLSADALRAAIDFRAKNQILIASGRYVEEQQIEDYSIRMLGAQNRRVIAEARLNRVQAILKQEGSGDSSAIGGGVAEELRNPIIIALLNKYNEIGRRLAENMGRYGPEHEAVKRIQGEMAEIQRGMDAELRRVAESLRSEAEITKNEEQILQGMLEELGKRATTTQKSRVELDLLESAAGSYTKLRDQFVSQYNASTQQESYPINETRILTRSSVPLKPDSPVLRRSLVAGSVFGLALGLVVAFGLQAFERRLRTRVQLESIAGHPCFGYAAATDALDPADNVVARELLDSILLNIRRSDEVQRRKVFGLAGAVPEHEASKLSMALARMAANAGDSVLLIDANLASRKVTIDALGPSGDLIGPVSRNHHGQPNTAPMATYGVVPHPAEPGLCILPMPANRTRAIRHEARLGGAELRALLDEARHHFDLVIVDLPPLAPLTSARRVAASIDGFVLAVAWNAFNASDLTDLISAYGEVGERMIGAVYTQVRLDEVSETEDAALISTVKLLRDKRAER